jgi:hypothetical protein
MRLVLRFGSDAGARDHPLVPFIPRFSDHEILSQRSVTTRVKASRTDETTPQEADMPFLFWLPMIVLSGMLSVAHAEVQRVRR